MNDKERAEELAQAILESDGNPVLSDEDIALIVKALMAYAGK